MRERLLKQANNLEKQFRANGYTDAEVAPEYCISNIGSDKFFTYTISIYVGDKYAQKIPKTKNSLWLKLKKILKI